MTAVVRTEQTDDILKLFNESLCKLTAYCREELEEEDFEYVIPPEELDLVMYYFRKGMLDEVDMKETTRTVEDVGAWNTAEALLQQVQ